MVTSQEILNASILLVDDQSANIDLLEQLLHGAGYTTIATTNESREVCGLHRQHRYDLILLDLQMPGMDGFEVMESLKEIETGGYLPVIVVTAQPNHKLRALKSGANDFISKPFDLGEVLVRVHNMLEVRLLHRETKLLYATLARRTAELEVANQELEAFSYSISHDLRAPLRAVDGFSQALLEDYAANLPMEGQRYLHTIRDGARKMGKLIDDLLTFSRLSRQPLHKQQVDTGALVRGVLSELRSLEKDRQIEVRLGELPECSGDPALLRQVWLNLLSNAFKYTRRREAAVVEIGCEAAAGGDVYFVRDNGTGFDMRYAGKLFGVFKRLHRAEDYEGTGVGLAIVQRVVHRHGGRIWAEAAVDQGATFQFMLEPATIPADDPQLECEPCPNP